MPNLPEQLAVCDARIAQWTTQLRSDDPIHQRRARRRINYWLDKRLEIMREEELCASSQRSASVAS